MCKWRLRTLFAFAPGARCDAAGVAGESSEGVEALGLLIDGGLVLFGLLLVVRLIRDVTNYLLPSHTHTHTHGGQHVTWVSSCALCVPLLTQIGVVLSESDTLSLKTTNTDTTQTFSKQRTT